MCFVVAVFCVICSLCLMLLVTIWWKTYSNMGLVMALYVARIVSFCFLHAVDVGALGICNVI